MDDIKIKEIFPRVETSTVRTYYINVMKVEVSSTV